MRFSPDGRSVAFETSRGAGKQIWRVEMGADPVQLTSHPKFEETFPQWSPDGNTIAFTRQPAQSPNAKSLWLMATDGANPRQILEGNNLTRWLPDGSGLVNQNHKNHDLPLRRREQPLSPHSHSAGRGDMPTPSPDAKWIVYQSTTKDVGTSMFTRSGWRRSPRVVASTRRQDYHPFFSPSGRWVYFQPDHKNLYRVPGPAQDLKPSDPEKITHFPESGLFLEDPQISRDGKHCHSRGRSRAISGSSNATGDLRQRESGSRPNALHPSAVNQPRRPRVSANVDMAPPAHRLSPLCDRSRVADACGAFGSASPTHRDQR